MRSRQSCEKNMYALSGRFGAAGSFFDLVLRLLATGVTLGFGSLGIVYRLEAKTRGASRRGPSACVFTTHCVYHVDFYLRRTTMSTVGIPVKLLHEAVGHVVTVELKGGATYRGRIFDAEDNFNISMKDIAVTARDGKQTHLDSVYIRGNMVRFMVVPDMLQQAPMFKRVGPNAMKGRGIGSARGRATIMRAQARRGRPVGRAPPIRR